MDKKYFSKKFMHINNNYDFELYVLFLLEIYSKYENIKIKPRYKDRDDKIHSEFDAIFPDGIKDLIGPSILEIKLNGINYNLKKYKDKINNLYPKYKSMLLIVGSELKENDLKTIENYKKILPKEFQLEVWDLNNIRDLLNSLINKDKNILNSLNDETIYSNHLVNYGLRLRLDDEKEKKKKKKKESWKEDNEFYIRQANQHYNDDKLVFFLGAGVSIDAGLPNWDKLINRLNISFIDSKFEQRKKLNNNEKRTLAKLLSIHNGSTPLISARYIKEGFGEQFIGEVKSALYKNVKPLKDQKILSTIAKCAHAPRNKLGICSIITYNFDDLLERHLKEENVRIKVIYREEDIPNDDSLPIYHVHGFLPDESTKYSDLDKSLFVFSEEAYHSLQQDCYSWSNLVQINALRENIAIFIGLSVSDPNLRRLLNIYGERSDECKHYVLLQRQFQNIEKDYDVREDLIEDFSIIHHTTQEEIFKRFGLNVIWYINHNEISEIIKQITNI
ncbi:MAG: SIR2 family protein [bacterium]